MSWTTDRLHASVCVCASRMWNRWIDEWMKMNSLDFVNRRAHCSGPSVFWQWIRPLCEAIRVCEWTAYQWAPSGPISELSIELSADQLKRITCVQGEATISLRPNSRRTDLSDRICWSRFAERKVNFAISNRFWSKTLFLVNTLERESASWRGFIWFPFDSIRLSFDFHLIPVDSNDYWNVELIEICEHLLKAINSHRKRLRVIESSRRRSLTMVCLDLKLDWSVFEVSSKCLLTNALTRQSRLQAITSSFR